MRRQPWYITRTLRLFDKKCAPSKSKPVDQPVIDLNGAVQGYGISHPPKGMSMADWKKGKMKL